MLLTVVLISNILFIKLTSCSTNSTLQLFFKKSSSSSLWEIYFNEEYTLYFQKMYIFIFIQFSPDCSIPQQTLFRRSKKISIFSIYVLSAQSSTQMIYNILNVIFTIPIIIWDLYPLLYFNFYTLWPNTGWPRKSLIKE